MIENSLLTYIYETSEFRNEGRVSDSLQNYIGDPNKYMFALWGFMEGIGWIFCDGTTFSYQEGQGKREELTQDKHRCTMPIDAQIDLVYREKFVPLFRQEEDPFQKCVLAYRYFLSVYEFTGFHYAGYQHIKPVMEDILEEFGKETGELFLTLFVTSERFIFHGLNKDKCAEKFVQHVTERYGEEFLHKYLKEFKRKYQNNWRFRQETQYYAETTSYAEEETTSKYVDASLVH